MKSFNRIKVIDFLWPKSKDKFQLFLAVSGLYDFANKKSIIFI